MPGRLRVRLSRRAVEAVACRQLQRNRDRTSVEEFNMTAIQEIVDAMLDEAHTAHPGFEFSIAMTDENTLLLPKHADFLEREVDGVEGAYRSHVYRDCMVWSQRVPDWMIIITPVG